MSDFARQQADFQRGILTGDDTVLAEILDSPREKRETLYGVYRYAYGSRLVEAMRNDHELLHLYLGDEMFDEMGHAYVKARPSEHPNLRWFSQGLPEFLKTAEPYCDHPVLSDLAALEKALNDAFDAAEGPVLELTAMAAFAPEAWPDLKFRPHPSAARLDLSTNAAAIWLALKNDETPPDAAALEDPSRLLIWRQDVTPMFRELPTEEAMMWDEAANGIPFGVLCEMLATYDDPDSAAARGAGYLHGWITSGILTAVSRLNRKGSPHGHGHRSPFYRAHGLGRSRAAHRQRRGGDLADRRRRQAAWLPPASQYRPHPGRISSQVGWPSGSTRLIWPTLGYGYYPAFVAYAGSSSLSSATFEAVVHEIASGILGSGCRKLFVLNTGISTLAPVERALARLDADRVAAFADP